MPLLDRIGGVTLILVIIALATTAVFFTYQKMSTSLPKPSHHVVLFIICDDPVGVLVTLEPPVWVSPSYPASDETAALMLEAYEADRVGSVTVCRNDQARR